MKRITREMADKIAKLMANNAYDEKIKEAEQKCNDFGDYIIKNYIPPQILECVKEFSIFFHQSNYVPVHVETNDNKYGRSSLFHSNMTCPLEKK